MGLNPVPGDSVDVSCVVNISCVAADAVDVSVAMSEADCGGILPDAIAEVGFFPLPTVPPTAPPTITPTISIPAMRRMIFPLVVRRNGVFLIGVFSAEGLSFLVRFLLAAFAASTSVKAGGVVVADLRPRPLSNRSTLYPS